MAPRTDNRLEPPVAAGYCVLMAVGLAGGMAWWAGASAAEPPALLTEITASVISDDLSEDWPAGTYLVPEVTGGGVALFDYDGDGDLDIYQVRFPPPGRPRAPARNRLFRQEADGRFRDVSVAAGLGDPGYGQGVAVGDADNDGDLDVYVTNFGADAFYLNNGDGSFRNRTEAAGFAGDQWSSSAGFVDYDRDGDLDLYVVHFVDFVPPRACKGDVLPLAYCGPNNFQGTLDTLYRNDGDGSFTDVTAEAGITSPGKGLGVVFADLTGDGLVDFYVANDSEANQLWVNNGDGGFVEEAILRGIAFNGHGQPEASMGVAIGDVNGDARLDLFMTHMENESNTLYLATEHQIFSDHSDASGMAVVDLPFTGFGCGFFDFDNDGDLDLALVNGRVRQGRVLPGAAGGAFWGAYAEPNLLFRNDGAGRFTDVSARAGGFAGRPATSRGLAFGDLDRDGDVDLVVGNIGGPPRLFRNDAPPPGAHWLMVRALAGKRDALGAEVTLRAGGRKLVRLVQTAYSYASSNDTRVHFGLGPIERIEAIEVTWPDGSRERFRATGVDRELSLHKGRGEVP